MPTTVPAPDAAPPADALPPATGGLRPAATVRAAGEDDHAVLLDLASGRYFSLNGIGLRVWRRLEEGATPEQAAAALAGEFSMPLEVVRRDVAELVAFLAGRRLLVPAEGAAAPRTPPAPSEPAAAVAAADAAAAAAGGGPGPALAAVAWLTLLGIDLVLRIGDLGRCLRALGPLPAAGRRADDGEVRRVVAAVDRAAALYLKRAWCLQRSTACVRLLRRRGVPARLVLGVRAMPFYAHAWAELDGRVLNDGPWVCDLAVLERF